MGSVAAALTPLDLATRARLEPLPVAVVCVSLAWYLWCLRRLAARDRPWPAARTAAWCFGELSFVVATMSGLGSYGEVSFAIPAAAHILSGMLTPVLFALAAPLTLAIESSGTKGQQVMTQAIHSRPARVVANPVATWAAYALSLFTYYFTGLYRFGVHHPLFGQAAQLELLIAGCLWIWPAADVDPVPRRLGYFGRIGYLILSMPVHTIFGMGLESQGKTLLAGVPLSSVHLGGGLIWVAGEALGLLGAIAVWVGWLRSDERWAKRADRYSEVSADRQLARWRAAREAAARAR